MTRNSRIRLARSVDLATVYDDAAIAQGRLEQQPRNHWRTTGGLPLDDDTAEAVAALTLRDLHDLTAAALDLIALDQELEGTR